MGRKVKMQMIFPQGHLGFYDGEGSLDTALRIIAVGFGKPDEWSEKYGTNFENDVFLMHRFCWCESDDCLWCGGSSCQGEIPREQHGAACYMTRLQALRRQYGKKEKWGYHVPLDHKPYGAAKRALCTELHCDFYRGNEVHCTCGSDADWDRRYAACECDWHTGNGLFRFGRATDAPHFWFKPSGFQVRWYKYIGRDTEMNEAVLPPDFLLQVFASHHEGKTVEQAISDMRERTEATSKAWKAMTEKLGGTP